MQSPTKTLGLLLLPLLVVGLAGCRAEAPPAAIPSASEAEAKAEATDEAPAALVGPARNLWFAAELGNAAIIARERQDFETAAQMLEQLLATPELAADDRGGAQWLLALEDNRNERYASAATRFGDAAAAPGFAPVRARLVALQARALLDASKPSDALVVLGTLGAKERKQSAVAEQIAVIEADAKLRDGDKKAGRAAYEAHLAAFPKGTRRSEVRAKLAHALANEEDVAAQSRAIDLYESLLLASPLSDYADEARRILPGLRKATGSTRTAKEKKAFERKLALANIDALLARRRYKNAIKAANAFLAGSSVAAADRCRALYSKASAIFKQRNRKGARPVFEAAAAACAGPASLLTYEVKSRYQAARGLYAEGKYAKAGAAFELLATERKDHSYADDALVLAGESWSEAKEPRKAQEALERALAVDGDMQDEARRRLLLAAFADDDAGRALKLCDAALEKRIANPTAASKLHYFRGRALAKQGDSDAAVAAWVRAVEADPLGYGSLQALSRLREVSSDALARGIAVLERDAPTSAAAAPAAGSERALILARLGLGSAARQELAAAGVNGWPAVSVLNQAGLYSEAQKMIANLGMSWRTAPPTGDARGQFELAHPLPFVEIVTGFETAHDVPVLLAFAVMKTESRFNPGATSWAGARGLIQLMPATAKAVATEAGRTVKPDALYDPQTNLDLGMRYLGKLVRRYDGGTAAVALAVPSYNAGAGAVDKWLAERGSWDLDLFVEAIPYDETRGYTQSVLGRWWAYRWLYADASAKAVDRIPFMPLTTPAKARG